MTRTEELRELMREHRLNADDVARLLHRSPHTVRAWRCEGPTAERQTIPAHMLDLLKLRLQQGEVMG
jgi:hypothetical protein